MKKRIVMMIATVFAAFTMSGCTMTKMGIAYMGFPSEAQEAYAEMMGKLSETGDPAQAMMKEWEITDKDLTEDDIFEDMKSLAGDYNMRFVGEKNMFRLTEAENPTPDKVVHARIAEFCSLSIAKKMLNHSRYYGGFMPCRVIYVEYGNGKRYLVSMDMTLAIYGGTDKKPIEASLLKDMINVKKAMEEIPTIAAGYDIDEWRKKNKN
ncbi:DUF302 domain-containing protein [Sulfurimonas sp.]|uniref:DUF302 domain-containing protein n=1 Tax=Sulfurimonas sp. TaxID=2022749 RepID=UPI003563A606